MIKTCKILTVAKPMKRKESKISARFKDILLLRGNCSIKSFSKAARYPKPGSTDTEVAQSETSYME